MTTEHTSMHWYEAAGEIVDRQMRIINPREPATRTQIVSEHNAHDALVEALEEAQIVFGKLGGNTLAGPYRAEWEMCREALRLARGDAP